MRMLDIATLLPPEDWASLSPAIQRRFSPSHPPVIYRGALTVWHSWAGRLFARLAAPFGRPLPLCRGQDIAAEVRVFPDGKGGVVWERWLLPPGQPARCVRSIKAIGPRGTLEERTGHGLVMALAVSVTSGRLVFESQGYALMVGAAFKIPLPAWLSPGRCRVTHEALSEDLFRFTLDITSPLWGRTFFQGGVFLDPFIAAPPVGACGEEIRP